MLCEVGFIPQLNAIGVFSARNLESFLRLTKRSGLKEVTSCFIKKPKYTCTDFGGYHELSRIVFHSLRQYRSRDVVAHVVVHSCTIQILQGFWIDCYKLENNESQLTCKRLLFYTILRLSCLDFFMFILISDYHGLSWFTQDVFLMH